MTKVRQLTVEEKDILIAVGQSPLIRRFFVGLLMRNLLREDSKGQEDPLKNINKLEFQKAGFLSDSYRSNYAGLLLHKKNLKGDENTDYYTMSDSGPESVNQQPERLFLDCFDKAFNLAGASQDPTQHNLISKIRVWLSFLVQASPDFPVLDSKSETDSNIRKEILYRLVELAKQPPDDSRGSSSRSSDSLPPEQNKQNIDLAMELLLNIWDLKTLRMLIAHPLNQDIITHRELLSTQTAPTAQDKNAIPFEERKNPHPSIFSRAPSFSNEYQEIILFLNKKLKVFEKINEYAPPANRKQTFETLQKSILTAKEEKDILQAFLVAVGDIKKDVGTTVRMGAFGGSKLYDKMQKACVDILGEHIDLLEAYAKQQDSPASGPTYY